jgi:hypothetical protein
MHTRWLSLLMGFGLSVMPLVARQAIGQDGALINPGLSSRLRWVQFEIVGGRIAATSIHAGTNMNSSSNAGGRRERLMIDLTGAAPNLHYELSTKADDINLEVNDGEQVIVRQAHKTEPGAIIVEFRQVPRQYLSLSITEGEKKRVVTGPTLWHLMLTEPEIAKKYLAPALELLRPNWRLPQLADAIENELWQEARSRRTPDRQQWAAWVAELAKPRFSERQAAERQLLTAGREVLPFLQNLDRAKLDPEQWRRVRNLITSLDSEQSDSVDQTVSFLSGDIRVWITLLERGDEAKRRLALKQIETIAGIQIDFDPAASAEERIQQIERLRKQFMPAAAQSEESPTANKRRSVPPPSVSR